MVSKVNIVGMGMGNPDTLTRAAWRALEQSQLVIGSARLLEALSELSAPKLALVSPAAIVEELSRSQASTASVVMSGDVGFYSGAAALLERLEGWSLQLYPGISSLSYFCAQLQTPWQDVYASSAHGRDCDVLGIVRAHKRSFFLTGGASSPQGICAQLAGQGLGGLRVAVGERLSYADERISQGTAEDLASCSFDPLSVLLVEHEDAGRDGACACEVAAPHLPDSAFLRGSVPMTKEEVRELAICKLRIRPSDTVWDLGSGTGSVTVEAARAAWQGQVFAVERGEAALALTRANVEAFSLTNVQVVAGEAPQALEGLPAPDCVFVGGSSGKLEQILQVAFAANPAVRICIAAISLETLSEAVRCLRELGLESPDVLQLSVAKARRMGNHHLMRANNPIFLILAGGRASCHGSKEA